MLHFTPPGVETTPPGVKVKSPGVECVSGVLGNKLLALEAITIGIIYKTRSKTVFFVIKGLEMGKEGSVSGLSRGV